jgi:tetratricopeptide (TPR) repeat protein
MKKEFDYANWASMTVYLRSPLDLSAVPLNGPRVPKAGWTDAGAVASPDVVVVAASWGDSGAKVAEMVSKLQPGTLNELELGSGPIDILPRESFRDWRGNVIRLDGVHSPLSGDVIAELNLLKDSSPHTDASDRLVWFFAQIARYGSPLVVWTNAAPHHMEFLKTIKPSSTLTFLLLYKPGALAGPEPETTVAELVDHNRLDEAVAAADALAAGCSDGELSAGYFAYARGGKPEKAEAAIGRVASLAERLLLSGNFVSRNARLPQLPPEQMVELVPGWTPEQPAQKLNKAEVRRYQEDWYRRAMNASGAEAPRRETGRAKHELGYLLQKQGQKGAAETLYRLALEDLEHSTKHGIRWHSALGAVLRDWADLLSFDAARLDEARRLLARAMAIHSFHGRKLEIAYSLTTAAQIALTGCHHTEAIDRAVDAANTFEACNNWDGWGSALTVMFDCLTETRETARMLALASLATEKLKRANIRAYKLAAKESEFAYQRAKAHWITGSLTEAREELDALVKNSPPGGLRAELQVQVERLAKFLAVGGEK